MRDKSRIRPYLNRLGDIWEKHPDLRFGQLIDIFHLYMQHQVLKDPYYTEDEELLRYMYSFYKEGEYAKEDSDSTDKLQSNVQSD